MEIKESDWKVFRELHEVALQRFCDRVLSEITELASNPSRSSPERYRAIYQLISEKDKKLAIAFDSPRRSAALDQLFSMHALNLLHEEEIKRFSLETRQAICSFPR